MVERTLSFPATYYSIVNEKRKKKKTNDISNVPYFFNYIHVPIFEFVVWFGYLQFVYQITDVYSV